MTLPDGTVRPVSVAEVEASHHRRGRYRAAPVLSEVFAVPDTAAAAEPSRQTMVVASVPVLPTPEEDVDFNDVVVLDEPGEGE